MADEPGKAKKYTEVIWYGRGGQGAITASQLVAEAACIEGYKGITTAPSFGAERRGAPVAAFLRLSREPIRIFSQVTDPNIIVVLDPTLLPILDLRTRFDKNCTVIVNSTRDPVELHLDGFRKMGIADITSVAVENGLTIAGVAILNTPILGAFVRLTDLIGMPSIETAIKNKFGGGKAERNLAAARIIYDSTRIYERG
ncbi:MAG: 2-oxoacid:acceptor oxidoreductase family protein [Spirochaetes bacterium]|jgi:2-oxoacid:acceptor oxidoreductase gamma subunit (pyruvate/2-ketoisovalerate family)|nr:2-oxoacid:acceptor oxidoreductase family protein [Spirochaetota bacterium]